MLQGKAEVVFAIIVTLWILFQTGYRLYYAAKPEKAIKEIRDRSEIPFGYVIAGYFGWCFFMLLAFYFSGLYNF